MRKLILLLIFLPLLLVLLACSKKESTQNKIEKKPYLCDKIEINAQGEISQTSDLRKPIIDFPCLSGNYSDAEIALIKSIQLDYVSMPDLKGVDKFYNLENLNLYGKQITDISDLNLLKRIKFFKLTGENLKNVSMQYMPDSLEGLYLYCPIQNDITFTEKNKNLKYVIFDDVDLKIRRIEGLENLPDLLCLSLLYCPLENPEELLKLKGLTYEIDFTVSRSIPQSQLDEILKELKINNPDCHRIFGCYFDETEKIENEFISPE